MTRLLASCALTALALTSAQRDASAQQAALGDTLPVDTSVTVGALPNGLRYYVRQNGEPRDRAELRLVVRAGSVLEDDDQLGLAHFVEHMAFNGTRHFEKQELVNYMEGIGMRFGPDLNAYTSFDETVYMLKVPTDSAGIVPRAFQILEDWARYQTFDPQEIDRERGVVIEEWRLGRGANARMSDKQFPILFKGSRYADRLPIGKKQVLESFPGDAARRFYRDWYRPDLMAVIAVGDFDPAEIRTLIQQDFAGIQNPEPERERPAYPVPDNEGTLYAIAADKEATFNSVGVVWKQDLRDERTVQDYRRSIVESLYNAMFNQRLFELTRKADAPFLGASSGQGRFVGAKEFYRLNAAAPDNGIGRALRALLVEAKRVQQYGFTRSELDREKQELLRNVKRAYDERVKRESEDYASEYIRAFLYDEPIPGIEYEYRLHQQLVPGVTLDEVNALARGRIVDRNRVVLVNAPDKAGVNVPSEPELAAIFHDVDTLTVQPYVETLTEAPLVATPPRPADIVEEDSIPEIGVRRWTLANGVRVWLKPTDFKDDELLVRSWSPGGTSLAPDSAFIPAATATSVVAQGGLGEFSLVDLQKKLAGKAVRVSPYISDLTEGVSASGSPSDAETMFQLIYLYFTAPRRDEEAFKAFRTRIDGFLANRSADPNAAFQDTLAVTLARHHYRARPPTPDLYREMDLDQSLAFYRDRFADAGDFTFFIVGSVDPERLRPLVRTYLGDLPSSGRNETWRDVGIEPPTGVIEKEVHKGLEPKSQTQIVFTGPFEWNRQNRYVLRSLAEILRIRLREVLREDLGATYSVDVSGSADRDPKPEYSFTVRFGSAPERVSELVDAAFAQVDSLKRTGPTAEELAKVKEQQRRARETDLRDNAYWLSALMAADRYGIDPREILSYGQLIDGLDVGAIGDAARRYLRTDNYVRVSLFPEESAGE